MSVEHLEVLVEEPSMEAGLRMLLPRMLGELSFAVYSHSCKDELLKRLPDRLRAYAKWLPDGWCIVVIVDRDDDDCDELKSRLEKMAKRAGLRTRSVARGDSYKLVNRLAIEELEAWFFGDWEAVRAVFPKAPAMIPRQAPYRDPDAVTGGTWEAFERVLQNAGYFKTGLRKIEAARSIAAHMDPSRNRSTSFQAFRDALTEMAAS